MAKREISGWIKVGFHGELHAPDSWPEDKIEDAVFSLEPVVCVGEGSTGGSLVMRLTVQGKEKLTYTHRWNTDDCWPEILEVTNPEKE